MENCSDVHPLVQAGVWKRPLTLVQRDRIKLSMMFLDGTNICANRKKTRRHNAMTVRHCATLRAAAGTKACVIVDPIGRVVAFVLAPGYDHELPHAMPLPDKPPGVPKWVAADRSYSSHAFREHVRTLGARPVIPTRRSEETLSYPPWIYTNRNQVERLWDRLKEWRTVTTRYEKTAHSFMSILCLATACDWIKCKR